MKHALNLLLLLTLTISTFAQKSVDDANVSPNSLVSVIFFNIDTINTSEPSKMWLSLPKSVKLFANDKELEEYNNYTFLPMNRIAIEYKFINATFRIILPNNKTIFKAFVKRTNAYELFEESPFFDSKIYLDDEGRVVKKVTINKPLRFTSTGESFAISTTLRKDEKILYLVDNKVVDESVIAKIDEDFMKKVFQMNAADSDLVSKFGERAKGFDNVFCIWTTDLTNKK
jgi:hypothetical protein